MSVQLQVPLLLLRAFDDCRSTGVLDLTTINWVDPALLVSVAAFVDAAVEEGRELEVSGPYRLECRRYMSRMRLGQILGQTVLVDARRTTHATGSFGAQIVKRVLMTEQAERLTIVAGPSRLVQSIQKTGEVLGVTGQLELVSELPASV
ncbi:MAG: hypothetical protein QOJ32_1184 [Frankiaceae bacterium]|nr:hypothetical protein [Frankiaceae bacterium]